MSEQTGPKAEKNKANSVIDVELVQKALANPDDFALIIERYEKKLLRYLIYFAGVDRGQAEDILQETMIKVYRNLNGFNQDLNFSSWIYRIAHNEALNYIRKNKRQASVSLDGDDDENMSLLNVLATDENIPDAAHKKEISGKVREVLNLLKEEYRELLVLRFLEGYDYLEISEILKKPMGTVGVMISRAKEDFRKNALKFNLLKYE